MTPSIPQPDPDRRLTDDRDLEVFLGDLLCSATHRQFWTMFFDREGRLLEPLMPMDDHPLEPLELCETEDLGSVTFAEMILARVAWVGEVVGADSVLFVWERPGPPRPSALDRRWVSEIADAAARQDVNLRTQFLLHSGGVRRFSGERSN